MIASDSAWIATAARFGFWSTDYVTPPGPARIDGVRGLVGKLIAGQGTMIELGADLARHIAPLGAAVLVAALIWRAGWRDWPVLSRPPFSPAMRRFAALLLIWSGTVFSVWLTGYASVRYLSGLVWHVLLLAACLLALSLDGARAGERRRSTVLLAGVFAMTGFGLSSYLHWRQAHGTPLALIEQRDRTLAACLRQAGGTPERTVLFASDELFPVQFGPLERWAAAVPPRNLAALSAEDLAGLIGQFRIAFAVGEAPGSALSRFYRGEPLPDCPAEVHRIAWETGDEQ